MSNDQLIPFNHATSLKPFKIPNRKEWTIQENVHLLLEDIRRVEFAERLGISAACQQALAETREIVVDDFEIL
jgi:hypothetical protein